MSTVEQKNLISVSNPTDFNKNTWGREYYYTQEILESEHQLLNTIPLYANTS